MQVDVCIIGAGGGGPVVAKELAQRGLHVVLIEAGPRHARSDTEWSHLLLDAAHFRAGRHRWGPEDRSAPAWPREVAAPIVLQQFAGVGGTTQHYFGNNPRAMPGVFQGYDEPDRDAYDTKYRFPFSYESLVPYYEWVEATLPVQTAPLGKKDLAMARGAEAIGLPVQTSKDIRFAAFRPQENAILQPGGFAGRTTDPTLLRYPSASGCTMCGSCYTGCYQPVGAPRNLKARRSTDNSYVPMALTADLWSNRGRAVTLVTDAFVTRIRWEPNRFDRPRGTARGVTIVHNASGLEETIDADVVVLAAGVNESPRLWLRSDLPNPNDWVGRGYTTHFFDFVTAVMPEDVGGAKGAGSSMRADFPGLGSLENLAVPPAVVAATLTASLNGVRGSYTMDRAGNVGPWSGSSGRTIGRELKAIMEDANRVLSMLVLTDDHIVPSDRVTLSSTARDQYGQVARIDIDPKRAKRKTIQNRDALAKKAAELFLAAGATKVIRHDSIPFLAHFQSCMRMGDSEKTSVLDGTGAARWVDNLYVADNAMLANALGGPNPTLTTQAIATKIAEHIFVDHFDGAPWVGHESPLSSIDDRVTSAVLQRGIV